MVPGLIGKTEDFICKTFISNNRDTFGLISKIICTGPGTRTYVPTLWKRMAQHLDSKMTCQLKNNTVPHKGTATYFILL
jgi:hypothetical protein